MRLPLLSAHRGRLSFEKAVMARVGRHGASRQLEVRVTAAPAVRVRAKSPVPRARAGGVTARRRLIMMTPAADHDSDLRIMSHRVTVPPRLGAARGPGHSDDTTRRLPADARSAGLESAPQWPPPPAP